MATQPKIHEDQSWLDARRLGIGSSEAGAALNAGFSCARRTAYDKLGYPSLQPTPTEAALFRRGHSLEDIAADEYSFHTGRKVRKMPMRRAKKYPWMQASVDRQILAFDERGTGALEVKTCNEFVFRQRLKQGMSEDNVLQLQHQLAVTDYRWGSFALLNCSTFELVHFDLERDDKLIALLVEKERLLWTQIEARALPDPLPSGDARCRSCRFRVICRGDQNLARAEAVQGEGVAERPDLIQLVDDYRVAKETGDQYAEIADAIKTRIRESLGEQEEARIGDALVSNKKLAGARRFDTRMLETLIDKWSKAKDEATQTLGSELANCKVQGAPTKRFEIDFTGGNQ